MLFYKPRNINIIENNSDYIIIYNYNNYIYDNINKKIYLYKNGKDI